MLALTFYGKAGDVLPPEPGVSNFLRIQNLRRGEARNFSGQIPWRLIHQKFRLPEGKIDDFVVA